MTLPWGTPEVILSTDEVAPLKTTCCVRPSRNGDDDSDGNGDDNGDDDHDDNGDDNDDDNTDENGVTMVVT